ncbi:hypothetical protein N781_15655 [Pontibacillus halophilus JSM 076056 = DSM 19796]|uniref:Uncharacterized protein n=1 Tax=Pontibacillus halophilus JSM 076056 = DSM 19796 TaxID=1385510 RepID=A0A0A5GNB0_9BACI|nr:hypothetical protein [Pontibacillus halophilus]KGX92738.1 hypothetical protein N781_15655 [Pontibacillus halophilus JSM 076056 = DSM 19796]
MDEKQQVDRPVFDDLNDRLIAEPTDAPAFSVKTSTDPKSVLEDNPYFDRSKPHTKEEIEKFKAFFGEK